MRNIDALLYLNFLDYKLFGALYKIKYTVAFVRVGSVLVRKRVSLEHGAYEYQQEYKEGMDDSLLCGDLDHLE